MVRENAGFCRVWTVVSHKLGTDCDLFWVMLVWTVLASPTGPCRGYRTFEGDVSSGASAPVRLKKGHCLSDLGFAFLVVL